MYRIRGLGPSRLIRFFFLTGDMGVLESKVLKGL